jgi:hypothetical protein
MQLGYWTLRGVTERPGGGYQIPPSLDSRAMPFATLGREIGRKRGERKRAEREREGGKRERDRERDRGRTRTIQKKLPNTA